MGINWDKVFNCPGDCDLYPIHVASGPNEGYFFSVLENYRNGTGGDDEDKVNIIRADALGNQVWRKKFGGDTVKNYGGWVVPIADGNYFTSWSFNHYTGVLGNVAPSSNIFLCKFDSNGGIIWQNGFKSYLDTYTPNNFYNSTQMQLLKNGNILISGNSLLNGDVFLLEVGQSGNPLWYRSYNFFDNDVPSGDDYSFLYGVTPTSDGGFICTGQYNSVPCNFFPGGIAKAFALKLDSLGCLTENCITGINGIDITHELEYVVFPNPTTDYINIKRLQSSYGKQHKIELYDLQGRLVFLVTAKEDITRIPIFQMTTGIYLIRVIDENDSEVFSEKVVVER